MPDLMLHDGAKILVCDGRSALFLRTSGKVGHEKFEVDSAIHQDLPSHTADMGSDRPGRSSQRLSGPGSAFEGPDWHTAQETSFIESTTLRFAALCADGDIKQVVIVAPPRALATIRKAAPDKLMAKVVAQIDKDLTRHPIAKIQKIVLG